jgi:hypothetical protein
MKKTFKQRTLEAQLDLIRRYEENDPPVDCPFCGIYWVTNHNCNCIGCFMAQKNTENKKFAILGCNRSQISGDIRAKLMQAYTEQQRLDRAEFHRKVRQILLKTPARYFTPSGWKQFNIPKEW